MTFSLQRLPEPLILDQVTRDPAWDKFKTVMVVLGGLAILAWLSFISFSRGVYNSQSVMAVPPPVTAPSPTANPFQWSSYADCQRHYVLTLGRDPEGACDNLK